MIGNKTKVKVFSYYAFSAVRILMGLLFIYSGISKFADIISFRYSLITLKLFAFNITEIITFAVPSIEIILGLLLVFGLFKRFAAIHLNVLIAGFAYVTYHAIQINLGNCNCLGSFIRMNYSYLHFILLLVLFALNIFIALNKVNFWALDNVILKKKKE